MMDDMTHIRQHALPGTDFLSDNRPPPLGMTLSGFGFGTAKQTALPKRTLGCFALVCLSSGAGSFESHSFKKTRLHKGDAFFLFPGEWHAYGPAKGDAWEEYWFLFNGPLPGFLLETGILSPSNPVFRNVQASPVRSLLAKILKLSHSKETATHARLTALYSYS